MRFKRLFVVFCFVFLSVFVSNNVFADTSFTGTYHAMIKWGAQADGAPSVDTSDWGFRSVTGSASLGSPTQIIGPTDSNSQLRKLYTAYLGEFNFTGQDSSQRFQNVSTEFQLWQPNPIYYEFGNYITFAVYNDAQGRNKRVDCVHQMYSESSSSNVVLGRRVIITCPAVRNSDYVVWDHVDLYVNTWDISYEFNSPYYYAFRGGGGVYLADARFDYVSSDNEELNAIDYQTTVINQGFIEINNTINDHYEREYESIDNISNQTPSDISDSENQKTSDLITALGSLVGAFTSIQPASDCNIQLDFPKYAGGTQIVNLCQYKEKAPLIPVIGSSVLLVIFGMKYFHVIIIKIYRVIRSFIDGTDDTEGED